MKKSNKNIDWEELGKNTSTIVEIIEQVDQKKLKRNIPKLPIFHNCTLNDLNAYSKEKKIIPRTNSDGNSHVFCSYGKCWYKPKKIEKDSLLDLPITFVLRLDPLIKDVLRVLAFDGGFAQDLHRNKNDSDFHFLKDCGFGNFLIEPSYEYINTFIEVLYSTYGNYYNPEKLKFNNAKNVLENPNAEFKELFKNNSDLLNKVAWIVTQTQYGNPKIVSTIEFFFSYIIPKRINVIDLHLHALIVENLEGRILIKNFIESFGYCNEDIDKLDKDPNDHTNVHLQPSALKSITEPEIDSWDNHLMKVNTYYANNWI